MCLHVFSFIRLGSKRLQLLITATVALQTGSALQEHSPVKTLGGLLDVSCTPPTFNAWPFCNKLHRPDLQCPAQACP